MTTPAAEVRSFTVTIPAGTPQSAPAVIPVSFPPRVVAGVRWKVPSGPAGLMGWQLSMSGGVPVIPTGGGFIVTDNDADTWYLQDQPDSGAWEVRGYNTDIYPHNVYLSFLLDLIVTGQATVTLAGNDQLSSPPPADTLTAAAVDVVAAPVITVPDLAALAQPGG